MKQDFIIYHGSQQIIETPKFGIGRKYNDYGQGFYCTENIELAKEWACPVKNESLTFSTGLLFFLLIESLTSILPLVTTQENLSSPVLCRT